MGTHAGSHLFTVGQRKRIGLTHIRPYFVTAVDARTNTVTVGREEDLYTGACASGA